MFAADGAKEKAYSIKITLSSSTSDESKSRVTQYASVYVSGAGAKDTPAHGGQLQLWRQLCPGGDKFLLELGLYNASGSRASTISR
jgi:hypothetical protein